MSKRPLKISGLLPIDKSISTAQASNGSQPGDHILLRTAPGPFLAFSLLHLLEHHGVLSCPAQARYMSPDALRRFFDNGLPSHASTAADGDVWPFLEPLEAVRTDADRLVDAPLPGFIFMTRLINLDNDNMLQTPVTLCTDPVLTAAVVARVRGSYYQANNAPDYTLAHFLRTAVISSDSSLYNPKVVSRREGCR